MPDREPLARVEYNNEYGYGVMVDVMKQRPVAAFYLQAEASHMADKINAAYFFALDREVEEAVKAERERCGKIAGEFEGGHWMGLARLAATLRSAPGQAHREGCSGLPESCVCWKPTGGM